MGLMPPRFDEKKVGEKVGAARGLGARTASAVWAFTIQHIDKDRKLREGFKLGAEMTNKLLRPRREEDRKKWQREADDIRARDPTLTKGAIYRRVALKFDKGERTIRRHIKLP